MEEKKMRTNRPTQRQPGRDVSLLAEGSGEEYLDQGRVCNRKRKYMSRSKRQLAQSTKHKQPLVAPSQKNLAYGEKKKNTGFGS